MERTFQVLSYDDLEEFRASSLIELDRFLAQAGNPPGKFRCYESRLIAICLAQGAAQHFVDLKGQNVFDNEVFVSAEEIAEKGFKVLPDGQVINGVKDIDVWFFFESDLLVRIPNRQHCRKSTTTLLSAFGERRFDFMKKGISETILGRITDRNPKTIVRTYLQGTEHGRNYLSKKSLIGLYPDSCFGYLFWATKRFRSTSSD
jgi:hypothetical protein